ncbi:MAG: hypothetical protein ABR591_03885 [Candidatus Velthaea sp.]
MKLVVVAAVAVTLLWSTAARAAEPFVYTDSIARGQTLDIHDLNGDVSVVQGDRLEVRATKTARRGNADDVKIVTRRVPSGILVCVQYPGDDANCDRSGSHHTSGDDNDTRVDFSVRVPSGVNVTVASVNGTVDVHSDALVSARTVNGRLNVDAADVTRATSVNGSIDVHIRNVASAAPLRISTVNGSVTCTVPQSVGLNVHASVLNGSIEAGGLNVNRPQYGPGASADGTLGDGRRHLDLRALNGSIRLVRS